MEFARCGEVRVREWRAEGRRGGGGAAGDGNELAGNGCVASSLSWSRGVRTADAAAWGGECVARGGTFALLPLTPSLPPSPLRRETESSGLPFPRAPSLLRGAFPAALQVAL